MEGHGHYLFDNTFAFVYQNVVDICLGAPILTRIGQALTSDSDFHIRDLIPDSPSGRLAIALGGTLVTKAVCSATGLYDMVGSHGDHTVDVLGTALGDFTAMSIIANSGWRVPNYPR